MAIYTVTPENNAAFTNLRTPGAKEGDHYFFGPYTKKDGTHIQITKGTKIEVDSAHPLYGDAAHTKVFFKVLNIKGNNPPVLPNEAVYLYKNDGVAVP